MMGGETAWNMQSIDSNKEYCITLHLVGYIWRNNNARSHECQIDLYVGVTFADLREDKYSVAVLEQQKAGQTVCRPSINSEGFVFYMFMVGFQFVWLFYTGANILNFMHFTCVMCEFKCVLFIFYYLNTFKWYVFDFPHTMWICTCCVYLWLPAYFQVICYDCPHTTWICKCSLCIVLPEYFQVMCSGLTKIVRRFFCTIFWNAVEVHWLSENLYYLTFVRKVLLVVWVWFILFMFQVYITRSLMVLPCAVDGKESQGIQEINLVT